MGLFHSLARSPASPATTARQMDQSPSHSSAWPATTAPLMGNRQASQVAQKGWDTNQASAVEAQYQPPQKCKKRTFSHPKKTVEEDVAEEESGTESAESRGNEPLAKKRKATVADKGKGKKIPEDDGSEEKSDSDEHWGAKFISKAAYDDYKLIRKKKHISEQPINVKACQHKFPSITKNMLTERKWHRLTQQMGKANLTVVREFYANYKHAKGDTVRVRGVNVDVSEQELNKFLETPSVSKVEFENISKAPNYEDIQKKLCGETSKVQWQGNFNTLSREYILEQPRAWLNWICSRLIQGTHKFKVTKDRVLLLYALDTGVPLDVADIMHRAMHRCLSNQQWSLYYPNTLTAYLKKCGVQFEKEDEWEKEDPPELDIARVRGPKKGRNAASEERLDNPEAEVQALPTKIDPQDKTIAEKLDWVSGMASPSSHTMPRASPRLSTDIPSSSNALVDLPISETMEEELEDTCETDKRWEDERTISGVRDPKKGGYAELLERLDNLESQVQALGAQQSMKAQPVLDITGVRDPNNGGNAASHERLDNLESEMQALRAQQLMDASPALDIIGVRDPKNGGNAVLLERLDNHESRRQDLGEAQQLINIKQEEAFDWFAGFMPRTLCRSSEGSGQIDDFDYALSEMELSDLSFRGEGAVSGATMPNTSGQAVNVELALYQKKKKKKR